MVTGMVVHTINFGINSLIYSNEEKCSKADVRFKRDGKMQSAAAFLIPNDNVY